MEKLKKLRLGAGKIQDKNCVNLDLYKLKGIDVVHDLNKFPWPFKDNEFDEIQCPYILELLGDFIKVVEELHRIAKPNATIIVESTSYQNPNAPGDPLNKKIFCWSSFDYFQEGTRLDYYSKVKFKILSKRWIFSKNPRLTWLGFIPNLSPKFYTRFLSYIFPSNAIEFKLRVIK